MICENCLKASQQPRWPGYSQECTPCFLRALSKCNPEDVRVVLDSVKPLDDETEVR